jgi:hypothetical protein
MKFRCKAVGSAQRTTSGLAHGVHHAQPAGPSRRECTKDSKLPQNRSTRSVMPRSGSVPTNGTLHWKPSTQRDRRTRPVTLTKSASLRPIRAAAADTTTGEHRRANRPTRPMAGRSPNVSITCVIKSASLSRFWRYESATIIHHTRHASRNRPIFAKLKMPGLLAGHCSDYRNRSEPACVRRPACPSQPS